MAVVIDASTPAAVVSQTAVASLTTAAFTPPAGAILLMVAIFDTATSSRTGTPSTVTGSTSAWSTVGNFNNGNGTTGGLVHISWARVTTSQSTTARVTWPASNDCAMKVWVLTGTAAAGSPIGAFGSATLTTNPQTVSYSATAAGSQGFFGMEDFSQAGTKTVSGTTEATLSTNSNGLIARDSSTSSTAGQTRSFVVSGTPGSAESAWVEVVPVAATGVQFRSGTDDARGASTDAAPTIPPGTVAGDLLLGIQTSDINGSLGVMTAPAGWTLAGSGSRSDAGYMKVWHKQATSADTVGINTTGGSGGPQTDRTSVAYTNGAGTSSVGHIYAGGLDWTKPVGLLVYTDGSGEFGLANPANTYLLAGTSGLIAVAKAHNMVLVTPRAPGTGCDDGDGVCWYDNSGTMLIPTKIQWADDFIQNQVLSQYNIDTTRVCLAGYSSGAQFTMEYYGPQYASAWMQDGLLLGISYGGSPKVTANYPTAFKQNVAASWDVGSADPSYQSSGSFGVQAGYDWYTSNGFTTTELTVVSGEDHSRDGQFGAIVDREITQYVTPAAASTIFTFVDSTAAHGSAILMSITGHDSANPVIVAPTFANGAASTSHVAPSVAGTSGALLVTAALAGTAGTTRDYPSPPSGMTTAEKSTLTTGGNILTGAFYQSLSTTAATGTRTATCSASTPWVAMSLVVGEPVPQTVTATGVTSGETLGTPTVTVGAAPAQTVTATGIASVEAFGVPLIGSTDALYPSESLYPSETLYPSDTAALPSQTITAFGFDAVTVLGTPTVSVATPPDQTVTAAGITGAEAFGSASVTLANGPQTAFPTAIDTAEAFGVPTVTVPAAAQTVFTLGIVTEESFGRPTLTVTFAPPVVSGPGYFDTYFLDGIDLSSLVSQIEVAEGLQDVMGTVGDNVVLPGLDGELGVYGAPGQPRRTDGPGRLVLSMWMLGVDPTTGEVGIGEQPADDWFREWDKVVRLFRRRQLTIDHPRPDGTRRAIAHYAVGESMEPTDRRGGSPWFGRFKAVLTIPSAHWTDVDPVTTGPQALTSNSSLSLGNFYGATAPCTELTVTFGPGNNPRLSTSYGHIGYNGTIAPGQQLVINTAAASPLGTGTGTTWTPSYANLTFSPGPRLFEIDPSENLFATLTHTGGGSMTVEVSGKRRYRTS